MANKPPCVGCEKCPCGAYHDKCDLYLQYKKQREAYNERNKDDNQYKAYVTDKKLSKTKIGDFNYRMRGRRNA